MLCCPANPQRADKYTTESGVLGSTYLTASLPSCCRLPSDHHRGWGSTIPTRILERLPSRLDQRPKNSPPLPPRRATGPSSSEARFRARRALLVRWNRISRPPATRVHEEAGFPCRRGKTAAGGRVARWKPSRTQALLPSPSRPLRLPRAFRAGNHISLETACRPATTTQRFPHPLGAPRWVGAGAAIDLENAHSRRRLHPRRSKGLCDGDNQDVWFRRPARRPPAV